MRGMSTRASEEDDAPQGTLDREAILARRQRFIAATLAGLTTSTLATACPCLKTMPADPGPDAAAPADAEEQEQDEAEHDDGDSVEEASPADGEIPDEPGDPAEPAP